MLTPKKAEKTIAICLYYYSVSFNVSSLFICSARNFNLQTVHNWHVSNSVKAIQSVTMSFNVNIVQVYFVDVRDQLTATAYSPKKVEGTHCN